METGKVAGGLPPGLRQAQIRLFQQGSCLGSGLPTLAAAGTDDKLDISMRDHSG